MEEGVLPPESLEVENDDRTVLVSWNGRLLGLIRTEERLRPDVIASVDALHDMGIRVELLTEDSAAPANSLGDRLGVDATRAELLPRQKLERIEAQRAAGRKIVMVGDGITDFTALASANVGVAMGSGTDVARQSADVFLLGHNLSDFVQTVRAARQCRRVIFTNFTGSLLVSVVGVGLAAFGIITPVIAAFTHLASDLIFILNAARLTPTVPERGERDRRETV
jgi:P-type E1-E2 ATPase